MTRIDQRLVAALDLLLEVREIKASDPNRMQKAVIDLITLYGYDSINRELLFQHCAQKFGFDYEVIYSAWVAS